jgi:hypothetical protein
LSGFAFACATSSFTELTGRPGVTTRRYGCEIMSEMGASAFGMST